MNTLIIQTLPETVEEFLSLRDKISVTPEGGVALFILAMKIYTTNKDLGKKFLLIALDKSRLVPGNVYKGYDIFRKDMSLIDIQLSKLPYLPDSYVKGTSHENGYKTKLPFEYEFKESRISEESAKVFVYSTGADTARPVSLRKNNKGIWKVTEFSSIVVGVRQPPKIEDDEI